MRQGDRGHANTARISRGGRGSKNSTPASIFSPAQEQLASTKKFQNLHSIGGHAAVGCECGEYGIKPLIIVRYELRSNTTPVATTDSALSLRHGNAMSESSPKGRRCSRSSVGNLPSGDARSPLACRRQDSLAAAANTSHLRRETRLQRWIHRNALAPLQYLILFKNQIVIL